MMVEISSTEVVRNFGDCLARIKYRGDSFTIRKNNEIVAELIPSVGLGVGKWGDLVEELNGLPIDPAFANDLERVSRIDTELQNPWD